MSLSVGDVNGALAQYPAADQCTIWVVLSGRAEPIEMIDRDVTTNQVIIFVNEKTSDTPSVGEVAGALAQYPATDECTIWVILSGKAEPMRMVLREVTQNRVILFVDELA